MKPLITFILILNINNLFAVFGQDTAILVQLVTTTASQLNELEKLASNAERYTKRMRQYNELFQDEYFKAQRIAYLAEEVASKKEVKNLNDLNFAIRNLKYSMSELKSLMLDYAKIKEGESKTKQVTKIKKRLNHLKMKRAKAQVANSITSKHTGRSTQLTAQNTALIYESQLHIQNNQRESINLLSTNNRLLAEELEDKRLDDIKKRRFYNLPKRSK
jgi:hypothetical protein